MLNKLNDCRLIDDNRISADLTRLLDKELIQTKEHQPSSDKMNQRFTQKKSHR
jgi:hypothetical protein